MYYDVLINYCGLDSSKASWSRLSNVHAFNFILKYLKHELNSHEYFIYVRKVFEDKQSKTFFTNFKLITHASYTFSHYQKINDYKNKYLIQKFDTVSIFSDRALLPEGFFYV